MYTVRAALYMFILIFDNNTDLIQYMYFVF